MSNLLEITGRKTLIINPNINYPLELKATYKGRHYDVSQVNFEGRILHFSRCDRLFAEGELNKILLMTTGNGKYRATGIIKQHDISEKIEWYPMGDDLEININSLADDAIKSLF